MQCLNGKKVQRLRDHDAGKGRHLEGSPTQANKPKGTGRKFTVQKTYKFKQAGNRFFRCQVTDKQKTKSRMQAHAHDNINDRARNEWEMAGEVLQS